MDGLVSSGIRRPSPGGDRPVPVDQNEQVPEVPWVLPGRGGPTVGPGLSMSVGVLGPGSPGQGALRCSFRQGDGPGTGIPMRSWPVVLVREGGGYPLRLVVSGPGAQHRDGGIATRRWDGRPGGRVTEGGDGVTLRP
jgi:hypothetical protein